MTLQVFVTSTEQSLIDKFCKDISDTAPQSNDLFTWYGAFFGKIQLIAISPSTLKAIPIPGITTVLVLDKNSLNQADALILEFPKAQPVLISGEDRRFIPVSQVEGFFENLVQQI